MDTVLHLTPEMREILIEMIGDAYAYRLGEAPSESEADDEDRKAMRRIWRFAEAHGFPIIS